jgi:tripartite-type tricarboxylate transporter receptor subunit TctC
LQLGQRWPLLLAGTVRLLAIADRTRSLAQPGAPTLKEAGGPKGVTVRSWATLLAPKRTPPAIVATLKRSLNETLRLLETVKKLSAFGFVSDTQTPIEWAQLISSETISTPIRFGYRCQCRMPSRALRCLSKRR